MSCSTVSVRSIAANRTRPLTLSGRQSSSSTMSRNQSPFLAQLTVGCLAIVAALGLSGRFASAGHASAGTAAIGDDPAPSRVDVLRASSGTYMRQLLLERDST